METFFIVVATVVITIIMVKCFSKFKEKRNTRMQTHTSWKRFNRWDNVSIKFTYDFICGGDNKFKGYDLIHANLVFQDPRVVTGSQEFSIPLPIRDKNLERCFELYTNLMQEEEHDRILSGEDEE